MHLEVLYPTTNNITFSKSKEYAKNVNISIFSRNAEMVCYSKIECIKNMTLNKVSHIKMTFLIGLFTGVHD